MQRIHTQPYELDMLRGEKKLNRMADFLSDLLLFKGNAV